jgi:replicative DNA helicase
VSQAERGIVGALLVDPSRVSEVARALDPGHFGTRKYREAYEAMLELVRAGKKVDAINLRYAGVDTADFGLSDDTAIEDYVEIVKGEAFVRLVEKHVDDIEDVISDGASKADIMSALAVMNHDIALNQKDDRTYTSEHAVEAYHAIREDRKARGVGLPYGIPALDKYLQPAHGGDLIIACARPSIGKTILAEHVADHWSFESDLPVLFMSIEMSLGQLMDRAVSRWGGVPSSSIVRGVLSEDEDARVNVALEARKGVNIWYVDNPYATTDSVRAAAAEVSMQAGGLRGIVVDYLQLMADKGDNDNQRVSKISRRLKALAREYDCPVLVLSQLSRKPEYREDQHPILSDLRDSGAIEQDADVVLGLYRDRDMEVNDPFMDIDILKNRQGPLARVEVGFDGDHVRLVTEA